jgi:DNA-binding response OmpR family regulator
MQSEKIYIALAEPIVQLDVKRILLNIGFRNITGFSTCERMVERTLGSPPPPELIIMESFFRRDADGIDAAKAIRDKYNIPLLFLTSRLSNECGDKIGLSKCIYLSKPFEEEVLINSVKNLLNHL